MLYTNTIERCGMLITVSFDDTHEHLDIVNDPEIEDIDEFEDWQCEALDRHIARTGKGK